MTAPLKSLADIRHEAPDAPWRHRHLPPALDAIRAKLAAVAASAVRETIKMRAREYALEPRQLDAIGDDLRSLPPRHLVTALAYIARNPKQYRHVGFGGEIPEINLRAAMLYARWSRAIANRNARRAT